MAENETKKEKAMDLTKPIRLKGSREVRKYGGPFGDGHVILNADGTFANTTPISMESIEAEYENVPEEQKPQAETVVVETPIGRCCDFESSRYSLSQVMAVPGDAEVHLVATDGRKLVAVTAEGHLTEKRFIPGELLCRKPRREVRLRHEGGRWLVEDGEWKSDEVDCRFPDINKILTERSGVKSFTIDAKLLLQVARAIGGSDSCDSAVTLLIDPESDYQEAGIACVGRFGVGVLMPRNAENCDTSEEDAQQFNTRASAICRSLVP